MDNITHLQAFELIDIAANEDRLYHHNGGQAYIRVSMQSTVLMVIDHASTTPKVEVVDGTGYFEAYAGYNKAHSARLRENGSLVQWYRDNYIGSVA